MALNTNMRVTDGGGKTNKKVNNTNKATKNASSNSNKSSNQTNKTNTSKNTSSNKQSSTSLKTANKITTRDKVKANKSTTSTKTTTPKTSNALDSVKQTTTNKTNNNTQKSYTSNAKDSVDTKTKTTTNKQKPTYQSAYSQTMASTQKSPQKETKKESNTPTKAKKTQTKKYDYSDDSNPNLPKQIDNQLDNPNLPNQIVGKPEIREIKTVNDFSNSNDYERYLAENKINSARGDALKYFQEKAKANGTTARQEMQSSRTKWKNALDTEEVRQNALNGEYTDEELSAVNQYAVYFNQDGSVYQGKELATYQNAIASLDEQEKQLEANYQYSRAQDNAIDNPNISTGDVYNTNLVNNDNYITEEEYKAQKKEIESQRKQANKYYLDNNLNTLTSKKGFEYYDWAKENDLDTSDFEAVAEAIDDDYVERLGNAYSASVIDTVNTFVQVPSEIRTVFDKNYDFTDENTWTSRLTQKANDLRTYAFSGTQGFENWSLQAVSSIMPQVNATLISVGTMGGSTALTTALMGLQTAGQVTRQRYEEGNDIKTALLNGVMHGIVSYAVEKIGAERFTSAITGEAESYLVGTALLSNVKLKNALQYINAIGVAEAGEEVMESFTNEIADDILNMFSSDIFGENADLVEVEETTPSELLNQMAMAYFGSGLVGAKAIGQVNINTKLKYNTALNLKAKFEEDRQNAIKLGNKTWQNIAEFAIDAINKDTQTFESKASPITFGVELKQDIADSLGDFNTWTEMLSQATQSDFQDKVAMAEQAYNNYSDFKNIYTQALAERGVMFKDNKIEQYLNLNEEAKTNVQNIVKQINDATPNYDVQFDTDMNANASIQFVDGKPLITLNPNSELAMEVNYTHELVHSVENSELYEQLADISFESETELQKAMKALGENAYKNADTETLQKEAVAKKLSEELLDEDFLDKLAKYNTDVGYKVLYDIRNTLSNIKGDNVMQQVENTLIKALNSQDKIYDMNGREINKSYLSEEQINEVINGVNISNQIGSVPFVVDELNIKNGLYDKYTIGEVEKSSTSNRIIYDGYDTSIKDFVNNTLNGEYNDSKNYKTLYIAKISNELSNEINNKAKGLNFDLTNYNLAIDSSSILHIKREHGNTVSENLRGQIPVQTSDFENLPYLIANADIIQKTVSKNGEPSINFITNMDNGRYTVVEFLRVGRHTLSLQTMYINQISKQKQKNSHNVTNESNSLVFTPEANSDMSSFNNNIANVEENVKQSAGDTLNNNLTQMLNNDNNLGEEGLSEVEINDFRRIQETSGRLSREESEAFHKGDRELNEGIRRGLSNVLRGRLQTERGQLWNSSTSLVNPKTKTNIELLENVDGQAFHDIFSTVQQYLKFGDAVDVHNDYSHTKNYLSSDGMSGFAIQEDGNLISVFNLGNKGFLDTIKDYINQSSANKLDCYQSEVQPLANIYGKKLNWKVASILGFNYDMLVEDKGKEYADYYVGTYGESPVAFMVKTNQDIETKYFDENSYDEAVAYRDSFINNDNTQYSKGGALKDSNSFMENTDTELNELNDIEEDNFFTNQNVQTAEGYANSNFANQQTKNLIIEDLNGADGKYSKVTINGVGVVHNKFANEQAIKRIANAGSQQLAIVEALSDTNFKTMETTALMCAHLDAQLGEVEQTPEVQNTRYELRKRYMEILNVAGRTVQSRQILDKESPTFQINYIMNAIDKIQEELNEERGDKAPTLEINEELLNKFNEAQTDEERAEVRDEITVDIASQIKPISIKESLWGFLKTQGKAWRYLSMLGNPRTWIKNRASNFIQGYITDMNRIVQSGLEKALTNYAKRYDPNFERLAGFGKITTEEKQTFYNIFNQRFGDESGKYFALDDTSKKYKSMNQIMKDDIINQTKQFGSKLVNKYYDITQKALSDVPDARKAFTHEIVGRLRANNQVWEDLTPAQQEEYITWAKERSAYITLNAPSQLASDLNRLQRKYGIAGELLIGGTLPFKRTNINAGKQMLEYSPLGLVKGVYETFVEVKNGKISANQAIADMSRGLTGTGLAVLGYALASLGLYRTTDDDKDRKQYFDEDNGEQDYALVIPNLGTFTIDWLDPSIAPISIGANIYTNVVESIADGNYTWDEFKDLATGLLFSNLQPLAETSMLSSLDSSLSSYNAGALGKIGGVVSNVLQNYVTSYIPTLSSAIAKTIDPYQRNTSSINDDWFTETGKKAVAKIPLVSSLLLEPKIDRQGNEMKNEDLGIGVIGRAILNLGASGRWKSDKTDEYDEEMYRLYDETGETSAFPSNSSKSMQYDNEKYKFTTEEYTQWNRTRWGTESQLVDTFIDSDYYDNFDDSEKVQIISGLREYAGKVAKAELLESKGIAYEDSSYEKIKQYFDMDVSDEQKMAIFIANKTIDSKKDENGETITNSKSYAIADAYADAGVLEDVFDYIAKNGLDSKDFGINKTVYKKSYEKIAENYEEIYGEKFGTGYADAYAKAMKGN